MAATMFCTLRRLAARRRFCIVLVQCLWALCWQSLPVGANPPEAEDAVQKAGAVQKEINEDIAGAPAGAIDATPIYTDYFEAHRAAASAEKDLVIYCFEPESPSPEQIEFERGVLGDDEILRLMDERFVFVKVSTQEPIQTQSTVRKTSYVRRGFRRVRRTWNQIVTRDLFAGKTDRPGLLVLNVSNQQIATSPDIVARFPFGHLELPPHVFRVDREFKPWTAEVFRDVVTTPVSSADAYLDKFCSKQSLDRSCIQKGTEDSVATLNYVYFDYDHTSENLKPDRIRTKLHIAKNEQLASYPDPISMRIDVHSLKDSGAPIQFVYKEVLPKDEWQTIGIDGLDSETPYRLTAYFYTSDPSHQLLGEAELPMYAVTNGPEKVAQTRAEIAMKALGEVRDWRRGSYDRSKGYVVGRWCERFYFWNVLGRVRTPYPNSYSSTVFSRHNALFSGRTMRNMVQTENVMGDHVRISGHGFMVLSYDKHYGQAWTIEGNFGNRVVLTRRYVSDYWSLGRIVPTMLLEDG
jgi:hypothetical protein